MSIVIDKDIPFPEARQRWPFGELEVGDSFRIGGSIKTAANQCCRYGKRYGRKFVYRADGEGFVRVWRVEDRGTVSQPITRP